MNKVAAVLAILIVVGLPASAIVGYSINGSKSSPITRTVTNVVTETSLPSSGANTSTYYTCVVSGPPIGAALHLVNDSGSPISGVQISGIAVGYCDNEKEVQTLPVSTTNSSGWAIWTEEKFGNYYLSFTEFGENWNITLPTSPLDLTLATYQLVSGNLNVFICYYGDLQRCQSQTTASINTSTTSGQATSDSSIAGIYRIPTNGTLVVSVKYYYYNSTAANDFSFSDGKQIFIYGFTQQKMVPATNFIVTSNVSTVSMGGPQNLSEGIPVQYKIHSKDNISSAYSFNFGWLYPSLEACAVDFELAIGNVPYPTVVLGGCTSALSNHYSVNSQGFVDGFLFAQLVAVSNDTSH